MPAPPQTLIGSLAPGVTGALGAAFVEVTESLPDLLWPLSVETYAKMRRDPQLAAILAAYVLPLRGATYQVDPAGCRDEVVQTVADDLGLGILGDDPKPGPARRRGVDPDEHIRLALLHLVYGHMAFELQVDASGPVTRLVKLEERMPTSIRDIELNNGQLAGIKQDLTDRLIGADRLVWYAHEREGAAWQGQSMLRPAFSAWLLKHELWRVLSTSDRRFGWGVPNVKTPPNPTPAQVEQAKQLAASVRVGEETGAGLPYGFEMELTGLTGTAPDVLGHIRYFDQQMAQSVLASVLNLDASPNGSRALGEILVGLLEHSWNATAKEITSPLTGLSVRLVDYTWGEDEPAPRVRTADIGSRPELSAEAIAELLKAGALSWDPEAEAWLRERYAMPRKVKRPPATAAPSPPSGGTPPAEPSSQPPATPPGSMDGTMPRATAASAPALPTGVQLTLDGRLP